jgi:methylated-DNA-protein-cysteine methyltransferase related protein
MVENKAEEYVEAVLQVVESIPPGRVMTYGAIADWLQDRFEQRSARRVGTIMSHYGGSVPWHRVVSSSGRLPPGHEDTARTLLAAEGVIFSGPRVRIGDYSWSPADQAI